MKTLLKPYDYQAEIIERFKDKNGAALFLEPGCGKSLITANLLRHKYNSHGEILRTIIFCPIIVLRNWERELLLSTHLDPSLICAVTAGSKAARLKLLFNDRFKIFIINYEALRAPEIKQQLVRFKAQAVVCDESHMIKSPKIKTPSNKATGTKHIFDVSEYAYYRYILSGTPITKDAQDLWSQYYFLDRGRTFGENFYLFKNKYFVDSNARRRGTQGYFPNWTFIASKEKEITSAIDSTSVRMKAADCLDLPELTEQTIEVEMSPEQSRHYRRLKNDLITWLEAQENNPLVVKNALTKILRLNELLAGYLKLENGSIETLKTNPRLDALMTLVESTNPHKIIIFTTFKQTYADIRRELKKRKIKYVELTGEVSALKKLENVDIFNDLSNKVRVCIANPQSGGVGVNLKAARYTCFYTRGYSMKDHEQARARNFRAGSIDLHNKITHYSIVTRNTVDEAILDAVKQKKNLAENLLYFKALLS